MSLYNLGRSLILSTQKEDPPVTIKVMGGLALQIPAREYLLQLTIDNNKIPPGALLEFSYQALKLNILSKPLRPLSFLHMENRYIKRIIHAKKDWIKTGNSFVYRSQYEQLHDVIPDFAKRVLYPHESINQQAKLATDQMWSLFIRDEHHMYGIGARVSPVRGQARELLEDLQKAWLIILGETIIKWTKQVSKLANLLQQRYILLKDSKVFENYINEMDEALYF